MRKTVHAIALPVALLLALGLSACNDSPVPVSESTGSDETTTSARDDSSREPAVKPSTEKPSAKPTTSRPQPTATSSTKGRTVHSTELQVGDCFSYNDSSTQVSEVEVVDCSAPHLYEVYNNYQIPQSTFPDASTMDSEQRTACYDTFETYVGTPYDRSQYDATTLTPTEASWAQGDHTITCILMTKDGSQVTGSLKGAAK